jgi:hypothetical protein
MVSAADPEPIVRFESAGNAAEIWGGTLANFLVEEPGTNAREIAVFLNDPAAMYLAGALEKEDNEVFREAAAREAGQRWIRLILDRGQHLPPVVTVSRQILEREPGLVEELRAALS